jgi:hypothetical protein
MHIKVKLAKELVETAGDFFLDSKRYFTWNFRNKFGRTKIFLDVG